MNKLLKLSLRVVAYLIFLLVVVLFLLEFFLTVTNIRLQNTYFEYEPDMGYRTIPYQHGSNHFGFNDKDYSFQKPAGVYRIVVLGDSFNWIGGRESNYVRFLQENFSKKMPNREIEVINAGYIGTHTGEQFSALKKYAMQYDPDLVVLGFFTGNDFIEANPERIKIIVNGVEVNVKKGEYLEFKNFPVIFKSRLFFLMLHKVKFKIAIPKDKKMGTFRKEVFLMLEKQRMSFYSIKNIKNGRFSENIDFVFKKIREMKELLKTNGSDIFVVIIPDQFTVDKNLSEQIFEMHGLESDDYNLNYAQDILKEYLNQEEISFLDLTLRFKEKQKTKDLYLLHDTHWNRAGARTAANQLYHALKPIVEKDLDRLLN